jgi:cytochrome c biogenesis protein
VTGGWLRWAWRQLTSMRTALLLLFLLAVAAVPGSIFPQRRIDTGAVQSYRADHGQVGVWLDRLGFYDVYTSPWFSAIYLLLFVSLVGCVVPRAGVHLRAMRAAPPGVPRRLERMPAQAVAALEGGAEPADVVATARDLLRRKRYRLATADPTGAGEVAAERGYLSETGNLVFHLALVGLLASLAFGSLYGSDGQAVVIEGQAPFSNVLTSYDSYTAGPLVDRAALAPFSFSLDTLTVTFELGADSSQVGAPRQFDAALTVRDTPGGPARQVVVRPNEPLDVAGTRVFLVGNGYAPVLTLRDGQGAVVFSDPVQSLPQDGSYASVLVLKAPDAKPQQIGLAGRFLPTFDIDPHLGPVSIFPDLGRPRLALTAYVAAPGVDGLRANSGVPQSVFAIDTAKLTQLRGDGGQALRLLMAPGDTQNLPDGAGSVTFEGIRRYAAFDIRADPSKGPALVSAILALLGLTASLFVRRRRVWVRVSRSGGRTVVHVAGLSRGDDPGLDREMDEVLSAVVAAHTNKGATV